MTANRKSGNTLEALQKTARQLALLDYCPRRRLQKLLVHHLGTATNSNETLGERKFPQHQSQKMPTRRRPHVPSFSARGRRTKLILSETESFRYRHMGCDKRWGRRGLRIAQSGPERPKQHFVRFSTANSISSPFEQALPLEHLSPQRNRRLLANASEW